nr:hypothetical protein [uncultured Dethiosulfovibrio sp.]
MDFLSPDVLVDCAKKVPEFFSFLAPDLIKKIKNRKLENAVSAVEDIEKRLKDKNLQVNWKSYFEQELKIPLELIDSLSVEEEPSLREALKKLFVKHASGKFDGSFYPTLISIVKNLSPMDLYILTAMHNQLKKDNDWGISDCTKKLIRINKGFVAKHFKTQINFVDVSLSNLERNKLITTTHPSDEASIGNSRILNEGDPALTSLGILLITECIEDI